MERICQAHGVPLSPPVTVATLLDRLIGHFVEPLCVQPTFVYDFPKVLSPLAKDHPTKVCSPPPPPGPPASHITDTLRRRRG